MKRSLETPTPLDTLLREQQRRRRLGEGAHCERCGCTQLTALRQRTLIVCGECAARLDQRATVEYHHPRGRGLSSQTVRSPARLHDWQSDRQRDWPAVLSTEQDPLILIAAALRAIGDFCEWVGQQAEEWSDYLLRVRDVLIQCWGESWELHVSC